MKKTLFVLAAGALGLAVTSCTKNSSSDTIPYASFAVVHASPDAPSLNIFVNGASVVQNFEYGSDTGYYSALPGTYNVQMLSSLTSAALVNGIVSFAPGKFYSLFAIDSSAKMKIAAVEDNFTVPSTDSVRVRFLHFSPNAPAVDLAAGGITVLATGRTFNDQELTPAYAQFITLAAGTYNLDVRLAGTTTSLLPLPNTVLEGGKVYTFYAKGFVGGTGVQALGAGTVVHNEGPK